MVQSKAKLMVKSRQKKIDAGLVHYREWVTPKEKQKLEDFLSKLRNDT